MKSALNVLPHLQEPLEFMRELEQPEALSVEDPPDLFVGVLILPPEYHSVELGVFDTLHPLFYSELEVVFGVCYVV